MHYNVYNVFHSQFSHQHTSAAFAAIFSVMLLLHEYKVQLWLGVSSSFLNN
jgi:hypothetical protein